VSKAVSILPLLLAVPLAAATPADKCQTEQHHGQMQAANSCYTALVRSNDPFARAQGYFGLGEFDSANNEFRLAYKAQPRSAEVKSEWGRLYYEHYQPADAAKLFGEAIEADPNYAPAYVGLARVFAQRFDKRALDLAREALKHDPKFFPAHEELAYLALEDSDRKLAQDEAQQALAISNEALDALAVLASMDWLDNKPQSEWMDRILKVNPVYGEAYETGGHFAEINYRYDDAIALYRKALALNDRLWSARSQLGVNLMRLGQSQEAQTQLERCYTAHYRNPETVNSLRLLDTMRNYETFKTPTTELVLNKKEAALLRPYFEPELKRVVSTYQQKYKMTLPSPVRLEVYPNHDDFIVRTLGLPGQGGLLGVTFGLVVAMDSPSARAPGELNWGSTMWHEMSHVFVLTATHHNVPRWFTEGLAVHEEGVAAPDWGSRLTPDIVGALEKKQLLPVVKLDRGFVRPEFPGQVLVSYYQAGKICDYIASKWGNDALLGMIHSYAARKTTAEAIQDNLHESAEGFDKEFTTWLNAQTSETVKSFAEWKKNVKAAHDAVSAGKTDEAITLAKTWRDRYPEYVGDGSLYEVLSTAYLRKNDKSNALAELKRYRDEGGTNPQLLNTIADLQTQSGDIKGALLTLTKLTYIYPEDQKLHQSLAKLALDSGDSSIAIRESEVLLALNPTNAAETHFQLAQALRAAKRLGEAKDQVLLALEAAPDYKPAQQLLLQLSQ